MSNFSFLSTQGSSTIDNVLLRAKYLCLLDFDDAVTVLRFLSFSSSKDIKSNTKSEIENIVVQRVQFSLLSFYKEFGCSKHPSHVGTSSSSATTDVAESSGSKKKSRKTRGRHKTFTRTPFYNSGEATHKRGDDSCKSPSFLIKIVKNWDSYGGDGKLKKDGRNSRQGSKPTKLNHH